MCHVQTITTAPPGTVINGGTFAGAETRNTSSHPYGDFLLHDIGNGHRPSGICKIPRTSSARSHFAWSLYA